jgi:hypothetical protein
MSIQDEVSVMRRIPLFAHIDSQKLKLLAFTSERIVFAPGQILFRQGDEGDAAYVIIEGQADVLVDAPKGAISVATMERNAIGRSRLCGFPAPHDRAVTQLDTCGSPRRVPGAAQRHPSCRSRS